MNICLFCAEEIQEAAIVYKRCGRELAPDEVEKTRLALETRTDRQVSISGKVALLLGLDDLGRLV